MSHSVQEVYEKKTAGLKQTTESDHEVAVKAAIVQMVERMEDSTLSTGMLAKLISYSPFHFDRIFRSTTGIPPRLYLSALRFQWSKKLLLKSTLSVTEVGQTVGYSSFSTFSSKFSSFIGLSPQQFRHFIESRLLGLNELRSIRLPEGIKALSAIEGNVKASESLHGVICIGLFPRPIPMGKPMGCTMVFESGAYVIPNVPDGTYYIMSIAFSWDASLDEYLHPQHSWRGKANGKITVTDGVAKGESNVTLRPPKFYDPPILISFPVLVQAYLNRLEG
ncbi:helix-turn-helix domain-containing protein [Paenibacillus sp. 2TAB26]|uniref:helix-turn-helix domain-containing protein n=1 Tax=Paenibacillus sp. 2TAB26 TaxID=3233005 RepID=UPI003F999473